MEFRWRADDGPLKVLFGSPHQLKKTKKKTKKKTSELDPLCGQNFLGPCMPYDKCLILYLRASELRALNALVRMRFCVGSSEPSLLVHGTSIAF